MRSRRTFIKQAAATSILLGSGYFPMQAFAREKELCLTVLHTNDVHSRIDPFPMDGGRNEGLGGVAARAKLIESIRNEQQHVLLLDAGDIFQGTPYFNYYGGEVEMKMMSEMGYDAATIGNHDFDAGIDGLKKQLPHANFPLISSNYDFRDTVLEGQIRPYKVFKKGDLKIGVFGLGIELDGLVPAALFGNTKYKDPISIANSFARKLKFDYHCNLVICLSHLGYRYREDKVSDVVLAENTTNIDLIIGGHTHTFLDQPKPYKNLDGEEVVINQVGWAGIYLGRIDFYFEKKSKKHTIKNAPVIVGQKTSG